MTEFIITFIQIGSISGSNCWNYYPIIFLVLAYLVEKKRMEKNRKKRRQQLGGIR